MSAEETWMALSFVAWMTTLVVVFVAFSAFLDLLRSESKEWREAYITEGNCNRRQWVDTVNLWGSRDANWFRLTAAIEGQPIEIHREPLSSSEEARETDDA